MNQLPHLFQKGKIGKLELRNRIVLPPMGLMFVEDFVNDRLIDFHVERAKGGVGLIIVSGAYTEPLGKIPHSLAIDDDKFIPGLRRLTDAVHEYGAKVGLHLVHGGKYSHSSVIGTQPVSASAIYSAWTREIPRELTVGEIKETITNYARAARRAKEAGFDLVEYNAYSGYLIREFLCSTTNKRTDEYGGDLVNRLRFFREIIRRTREEVGEEFPLVCKISGNEFIPGGNAIGEGKVIARELEKEGVDALHVSPGGHDTTVPLTPGFVPKGAFVYLSQGVKEEVSIPVITAHIGDVFLAEEVLAEGRADFIAFGRALIADSELPLKAEEGRFEDIRKCIRCLQGCYDRVFSNQLVSCLVNATVGREKEFKLKPALRRKKVIVVGGGPAGMEAARVLSLRGHEVSLYEKEDKLGGQLNFSSVVPGKEDFQHLTRYLAGQLEKLGVNVSLGEEVTSEFVIGESPDAIIVATGATPIIPEIPGVNRDNVVTAKQVLAEEVRAGRKVVVIGGGGIGCETALFLVKKGAMDGETALFLITWGALDPETAIPLTRKGREVTIIEKLPSIGGDIGITRRGFTRRLLTLSGVNIITGAEVREITGSGVEFIKDGQGQTIEADTVVIAMGTKPEDGLYRELEGKVSELYLIGDGKRSGKAFEAIHEGASVARQI